MAHINLFAMNLNVNVSVYSLISPFSSADFTIYTLYWNTLLYSLVCSGKNSAFKLRTSLQL